MTDEFDIPTNDMTDSDSTEFVFRNYPVFGTDSVLRTVLFGPGTDDFNLLISMNPETGVLELTAGNGPDHRSAPTLLADTLLDISQILRSLNDDPGYQAALNAEGQ